MTSLSCNFHKGMVKVMASCTIAGSATQFHDIY